VNSTQEKALGCFRPELDQRAQLPGNRDAAEITEEIDLITDGAVWIRWGL